MKASLPFKYILSKKNDKMNVIFDFKDDNNKRKGSEQEQDFLQAIQKKALNARVSKIIAELCGDYCSGKAMVVIEKVVKKHHITIIG